MEHCTAFKFYLVDPGQEYLGTRWFNFLFLSQMKVNCEQTALVAFIVQHFLQRHDMKLCPQWPLLFLNAYYCSHISSH
jgi:hypothetical protein